MIGRASLPGLPWAVVTQTLGGGAAPSSKVVRHVHVDDGSGRRRLLLCTDGLTNFVARHDIADILPSGGS
jgi:serine/threonine protein phosphatase PrpC